MPVRSSVAGPPVRSIEPVLESCTVEVWRLVGVRLIVPPEPLKSSPPMALVNVPVDSVPGPPSPPAYVPPIVTMEFDGIALSMPRTSVPFELM